MRGLVGDSAELTVLQLALERVAVLDLGRELDEGVPEEHDLRVELLPSISMCESLVVHTSRGFCKRCLVTHHSHGRAEGTWSENARADVRVQEVDMASSTAETAGLESSVV